MNIKNTDIRYGLVAVLFHWFMACIIIALIGVGLYMSDLPLSPWRLKLYGLHKAFGLLVLVLAIARLSWRLLNVSPRLDLPWYERWAAKSIHWAFYALMVLMPLTGWLMSSASGLPVSFFGLFTMPDLIAPNEHWRHFFNEMHEWIGYCLIGMITLHTAAAFKHHFFDQDDILRRML